MWGKLSSVLGNAPVMYVGCVCTPVRPVLGKGGEGVCLCVFAVSVYLHGVEENNDITFYFVNVLL